MPDQNRDGWVEILPTNSDARSYVTVYLIKRKHTDKVSIVIPAELWPVLANAPTRFSAWRKGNQVRLEPDEDGAFKGGWRGQNKRTYGITVDAWDGIGSAPSEKYVIRPDISDGCLTLELPPQLFKTGKPRAAKAPSSRGPLSSFDPPKTAVATGRSQDRKSPKDRLTDAMRD